MISSRDSKQFVTRNFVFRTSFFPDPVLSILLHRDTTCKLRKRAANYFSTTIGIILHHYYYPLLVPTIEKYRSIEIILPRTNIIYRVSIILSNSFNSLRNERHSWTTISISLIQRTSPFQQEIYSRDILAKSHPGRKPPKLRSSEG